MRCGTAPQARRAQPLVGGEGRAGCALAQGATIRAGGNGLLISGRRADRRDRGPTGPRTGRQSRRPPVRLVLAEMDGGALLHWHPRPFPHPPRQARQGRAPPEIALRHQGMEGSVGLGQSGSDHISTMWTGAPVRSRAGDRDAAPADGAPRHQGPRMSRPTWQPRPASLSAPSRRAQRPHATGIQDDLDRALAAWDCRSRSHRFHGRV